MKLGRTVAALVVVGAVGSLSAETARRKVLIDQDSSGPGGPNLQPVLILLQAPDVAVLGIRGESGDG